VPREKLQLVCALEFATVGAWALNDAGLAARSDAASGEVESAHAAMMSTQAGKARVENDSFMRVSVGDRRGKMHLAFQPVATYWFADFSDWSLATGALTGDPSLEWISASVFQ
jgi:hypothetical protein